MSLGLVSEEAPLSPGLEICRSRSSAGEVLERFARAFGGHVYYKEKVLT